MHTHATIIAIQLLLHKDKGEESSDSDVFVQDRTLLLILRLHRRFTLEYGCPQRVCVLLHTEFILVP